MSGLGIDDFEVFDMEGWVSAEGEAGVVGLFDIEEGFFVFGAESFEDGGVEEDFEADWFLNARAFVEVANDADEFALDFDAEATDGFNDGAAVAVGAGDVHTAGGAFLGALTGHLHDAEWGDGEDVAFCFIFAHFFPDDVEDGLAVATVFHIDEVEDDEAADVAEFDLAGDFVSGFEIGLDDVVFAVFASAFMGAGIYVDGGEGFGFFDDDFASGGEGDAFHEGLFDLAFDIEAFEDWDFFFEECDFVFGARGDFLYGLADEFVVFLFIDEDAIDVFGKKVSYGAFEDIGFLVEEDWFFRFLDFFANGLPFFEEEMEVADEVAGFFAFAGGADNDAHALGDGEGFEDGFEAIAFFAVFDFSGDTALAGVRGEDEEAAWERDVGGDTWAFGTDLRFGDLDDDVGADGVESRDVFDGNFFSTLELFCGFVFADDFDGVIAGGGENVPIVEEGVFRHIDIDEGGF